MATHLVNLDALIEREDFEEGIAQEGSDIIFKIEELEEKRAFVRGLRKPDFQRDTNNWSPQKIVDFVRDYLDNKMIPAVILWQSMASAKTYIIDGAHRISALIAWVHDDYGDGEKSRKFFGDINITTQQKTLAEKTRSLISSAVGKYADLKGSLDRADGTDEEMKKRARRIGTRHFPTQAVVGNADDAENAFLTINDRPATIDPTELDVIRARNLPNAIATRAIMRGGMDHPSLKKYPTYKAEIQNLAKETKSLIFGQFETITIESPDLPRAGQPYSAQGFKMVLDMVNLFNDITPGMWRETGRTKSSKAVKRLVNDDDGSETVRFIKSVRAAAALAASREEPGSVGLDLAVYSFGKDAKFYPAALIAAMEFVRQINHKKRVSDFTKVRARFEDFLVSHKYFLKQLAHSKGSRTRSLAAFLDLFNSIMDAYYNGTNDDKGVIDAIKQKPTLKDIKEEKEPVIKTKRAKFSKEVQAAGVLSTILQGRERCPECSARIPPYARSKDHKEPKSKGGLGTVENLQFTHPYCNSARDRKNKNISLGT